MDTLKTISLGATLGTTPAIAGATTREELLIGLFATLVNAVVYAIVHKKMKNGIQKTKKSKKE